MAATRSPKIWSSSRASGAGCSCRSASNPLKINGSDGSVSASAVRNATTTSSQLWALQGAIERTGASVMTPLMNGCPCGSTKPGKRAPAPVLITRAPGSAVVHSVSDPTATMRFPDTATASARGRSSSIVITVAAVRMMSDMLFPRSLSSSRSSLCGMGYRLRACGACQWNRSASMRNPKAPNAAAIPVRSE